MNTPNPKFLELFKLDVENRAFSLLGCETRLSKRNSPEDRLFYSAWRDFELLHQSKYRPVAEKYGISQAPGFSAKLQVFIGNLAYSILPERWIMKYLLDETEKYVVTLEELAALAPEEDKEFFEYVVSQERHQLSVLPLRIEGKSQEPAELLMKFVSEHS